MARRPPPPARALARSPGQAPQRLDHDRDRPSSALQGQCPKASPSRRGWFARPPACGRGAGGTAGGGPRSRAGSSPRPAATTPTGSAVAGGSGSPGAPTLAARCRQLLQPPALASILRVGYGYLAPVGEVSGLRAIGLQEAAGRSAKPSSRSSIRSGGAAMNRCFWSRAGATAITPSIVARLEEPVGALVQLVLGNPGAGDEGAGLVPGQRPVGDPLLQQAEDSASASGATRRAARSGAAPATRARSASSGRIQPRSSEVNMWIVLRISHDRITPSPAACARAWSSVNPSVRARRARAAAGGSWAWIARHALAASSTEAARASGNSR